LKRRLRIRPDDPPVEVWFEWRDAGDSTVCTGWLAELIIEDEKLCWVKVERMGLLLSGAKLYKEHMKQGKDMRLMLRCPAPYPWWTEERRTFELLAAKDPRHHWVMYVGMSEADMAAVMKAGNSMSLNVRDHGWWS